MYERLASEGPKEREGIHYDYRRHYQNNEQIRTYITKADEALVALGYTEHSFAHVTKVARFAKELLLELGYGAERLSWPGIAG
mgnify:CR=1 FL=1